MDIDVRITLNADGVGIAKAIARGLKGQDLTDKDLETALVHNIVADIEMVTSAVVLRYEGDESGSLNSVGVPHPDETTRQER